MQDPLPLAGRYRFGRRFGGPSAAIWLAFDDRTDRQVVVSLIPPARAAELASSIGVTHPHLASIVEILDDPAPAALPPGVRVERSLCALIADYVAGETLYAQIERGPLPRPKAIACVAALAGALQALHRRGGVHGALSPLSVVVARADGGAGPVVTQGLMPGLAEYASPEHHAGAPRSPADDVWALHATLHAALTGRPPPAIGPGKPPLELGGHLDELLDTILQSGLAPSLGARTGSAEDLEESLGLWIARSAARRRDVRVDDDVELPAPRAAPRRRPSSTSLAAAGAQRLAGFGMGARAERVPSVPPAAPLPPAPPAPPAPAVEVAVERAAPVAPLALPPPGPEARAATPSTRPTFAPGFDAAPEPLPEVERAPEPKAEPADAVEPAPAPKVDRVPEVASAQLEPRPVDATRDAVGRESVPRRASSRRWGPIGAGALLFAGIVVALALLRPRSDEPVASTSPAASPGASNAAPAPAPPETAAKPDATAPVATAAPPAPKSSGDPSRCLAAAFPTGSFSAPPDLGFVCDAGDARGIAKKVHTRLIVAGAGLATPAGKEWAKLEWYELAALAVLRGRCCPAAAPIELPPSEPCEPLGPTLDRLAAAVSKRSDVELRVLGFDKNVVCLSGQATRPYRYVGHPYGGGQRVFAGFLARNTK